MTDTPKLVGSDTLRQAYPKINQSIDRVNNFKSQIDQMVVEGDSSVEAAQARVKADGTVKATLKDRLDESDAQFAQTTTKVNNQRYFINVDEEPRLAPETSDSPRVQRVIDSLPSEGGTVFFPPRRLEWTGTVTIANKGKVKLMGAGFASIITATGTAQNQINYPLFLVSNDGSAKFECDGLIFQAFQVATGATAIRTVGNLVDVSIHNCWFTQTGSAIEGQFITLNFSNNIVELLRFGGIVSETPHFRKVVIADNQFFAINNDHIRLKNTGQDRGMHNISITGNGFDQGLASAFIATGQNSIGNGIYLEGVDLFTIEGNYFNGYTPAMNGQPEVKQSAHAIRLKDCKDFAIGKNTYSKYKGSAFYFENCSDFQAEGVAEGFDGDTYVLINCIDFEIDVVGRTSKSGVFITGCTRFKLNGISKNNREHGVIVTNSSYGEIHSKAVNNNTSGLANMFGVFLNGTTNRVRVLNADAHVTDPQANGHISNIVLASTTSNCRVSNCNLFPFKTSAIVNNGTNNTIDTNNVVA